MTPQPSRKPKISDMVRGVLAAANPTEAEVRAVREKATATMLRAGADPVYAAEVADQLATSAAELAAQLAMLVPAARECEKAMVAYGNVLRNRAEKRTENGRP